MCQLRNDPPTEKNRTKPSWNEAVNSKIEPYPLHSPLGWLFALHWIRLPHFLHSNWPEEAVARTLVGVYLVIFARGMDGFARLLRGQLLFFWALWTLWVLNATPSDRAFIWKRNGNRKKAYHSNLYQAIERESGFMPNPDPQPCQADFSGYLSVAYIIYVTHKYLFSTKGSFEYVHVRYIHYTYNSKVLFFLLLSVTLCTVKALLFCVHVRYIYYTYNSQVPFIYRPHPVQAVFY